MGADGVGDSGELTRDTYDRTVGVILEPINNTPDLQVNWWNWRPTVAILVRAGVVHDDLAERLNVGIGAADITDAQAIAIADAIDAQLASVPEGHRVLLEGEVTDQGPARLTLPAEYDWYGAERDWLLRFVEFCRRSGGFTPL